jgi:hypothetical protein
MKVKRPEPGGVPERGMRSLAFFNIRAITLTKSHNNVESGGAWMLDSTTVQSISLEK